MNCSQRSVNAEPLEETKPSLPIIGVEGGLFVLVDADLIFADIAFLILVFFVVFQTTVLLQQADKAIGAQNKINIGQAANTGIAAGIKDALDRTWAKPV